MASGTTDTAMRPAGAITAESEAGRSGTRVRLSGVWTIAAAGDLSAALGEASRGSDGPVVIDGSDVERLDTAGAFLIHQARRRFSDAGRDVQIEGFSPPQMILIDAVARTGKADIKTSPSVNPIVRFLSAVGVQATEIVADLVRVVATLGEFLVALLGMLAFRRRMRWAAFVNHLDRTGLQAVPIVSLMSFLIGMIIAQQGGFYFRTYGAELFVVDLVGILVCREIGVLLTAIMVAGRSGSAFTAEIGSMRMREEIDALTVLGVSPVDVLVVPRLLALVIALPILTLVADLAALAGSWVVVTFYMGIPSDTYFLRLQQAMTPTYFLIGIMKAPFMAMVVGLMACVEGMKVEGSAESLGSHTTSSVVKAIFMVIVIDGVFAMFFAALGI